MGRALLALVLALLFYRYGWISWGWWLLGFGIVFYASGLRTGGNREFLFPGTILVVIGFAVLLRQYQFVDFQLWRIWPILFGATGLGFIMVWSVRQIGNWALIPGGLLLFVSGAGFSNISFVRYQIWLRRIFDLWPLLLIIIVILLIVHFRRVRIKG